MARFRKASADEVREKRKDHVRATARGDAIIKGFKSPPTWNEEKRSARFTMTSEGVDRYGDIVGQAGMHIERFLENPQGLLFHNSRSWPCGNWSDVTKLLSGRPKRTEGTLNFLPIDVDEDADRAARHVAAGTMRTVSIGFIPDWDQIELILDDEEEWVTGYKFVESELVECSLVPIPANPDALVKDAGGDLKLARDLIEDILDSYAMTPEGLLLPMDEYRAKHFDLVGERSFHIVRGIARETEPKTVKPEVLELTAATKDEAQAYVGFPVSWKANHPDNAEEPALSIFANCVGEIISAWLVPSGEFKGILALDVEWSNKEGTALGMYRGLKAERVLLAQKPNADDAQAKGKCLLDAAQIVEFVDGLRAGDVLSLGEEHESMVSFMAMRDGKVVAYKKVKHGGLMAPGAESIEKDRDATLDALKAKVAELSEEPEPVAEITREPEPAVAPKAKTEVGTIEIKVDATAATKELTGLSKLADEVRTKLASIFGRQTPEVVERTEPVIIAETPPAPAPEPTEADIAAARTAADALISRYESRTAA